MAATAPREGKPVRSYLSPSETLTVPGGITYPPEPPCGLGRALERILQANPALRERVEMSRRAQRMDLLRRLAKALRARLHA